MGRTQGHDDVTLAWEIVGAAPVNSVYVHATGFCKETWGAVLDRVRDARAVSLDQRGHGDSQRSDGLLDWWDLGRDVLAVIDAVPHEVTLTGVGHSSGGAAIAMAEVLRPGTFSRLVLVEPIIFPPPRERTDGHLLAALALKRRRSFDSSDHAAESYRQRSLFAGWEESALRAFVEHGFAADAQGWSLKCDPEFEAEFYRTARLHDAWDRLGEISCPVDLVFGGASDAEIARLAADMTHRVPRGRLTTIEGAGHLIPMEYPDALAAVIDRA